jgi:type II secretory pathway pseudopilin PulG
VARCRRRKNEQGFALLLVFLMAAIVGITLYMEVPRVAMQSQRDKEQALIDRGEQYKRAIQLFVAKAKRYPGDIKELESFQNQRFLRQRYIDPMTGKDEWRLIHIQGGVLTDSKVTKPTAPGGKEEPKGPNGFVGEQAGMGALPNPTQGGGAASARERRRPSDGNNGTMPGPAIPGGDVAGGQNPENGQPPFPGAQPFPNSQSIPGQTGQPTAIQPGQTPPVYPPGVPVPAPQGFPGQAGISPGMVTPGQPAYYQGMPAQPGMPGSTSVTGGASAVSPGNTSASGSSFVGGGGSFVGGGGSYVGGGAPASQPVYPLPVIPPGQANYPGIPSSSSLPGQPGSPVNSQSGGMSPYPIVSGANGTPPGFPQPGTVAGQNNPAADMIRNILTTPRPGGMPQTNPGAQTIGGGIAGVATTAEGEGVKVYNDRTLYQEWEFVYDQQKQKQIPNPNAVGAGGTPADRMNNNGQPSTSPGMGTQPPRQPGR